MDTKVNFYHNSAVSGFNPHSVLRTVNCDPLFETKNVEFIQGEVLRLSAKEFERAIKVDFPSITRILQRTIEMKVESLERLNERAIMTLMNEIRDHFLEAERNLGWEADYQKIGSKAPIMIMGMKNRPITGQPGREKVGGTLRFRETF